MTSSFRALWLMALVMLAAGPAIAQPQPGARIAVMNRDAIVSADGGSVTTSRMEIRALTPEGATQLSQTVIGFNESTQQVEVTEAFTRKADGRELRVTPDAIFNRETPRTGASPVLSDARQKVILFPNVENGDTVVYTAILRARPIVENQLFFTVLAPASLIVDDASFVIRLPAALKVYSDARNMNVRREVAGDQAVYTIRFANPQPQTPTLQPLSEFDRAGRFNLSSVKDYDTLADIYAGLALPMIAVTPAIRAQAEALTGGVNDPFQQARLIYQWISSHIRYVALEFGQGRLVPRSADTVLANAYGDCKDQAVLFAAMLKAKGIDSNLVLINATNAYSVSDTPTFAPFDHMIVWIPRLKLYADPTNGRNIPFGLLPRSEYGKQTVHIGDPAGARHAVPMADPDISEDHYRLALRMDDAGYVEAESSHTATGDFAAMLRELGALMQGDKAKALAAAMLAKANMPNATGALMAPPPDVEAADYRISATWALPAPVTPSDSAAPVRMGDSLQLVPPVGALFYGPLLDPRFAAAEAVPCFGGRSIDEQTITFPASRRLAKLPEDADFQRGHVRFTARWSQTPTSVSVRRSFEARFDAPLCGPAERQEMMAALARLQADMSTSLTLTRN